MEKYRYITCLALWALLTMGLSAQQHPTVDLGLPSGTLWSTCDIGSDSPCRLGDYFAWGETKGLQSGKGNFTFSNYEWGHTSKEIQKYNTQEKNGQVDGLTELEPCDDAATVLWGEGWRIPSEEQVRELLACCTWSWVIDEETGVRVCRFVSKSNGHTLSFTTSGAYFGTDCQCSGFFASFWLRNLREDNPRYAKTLYMEVTRTGKTPGFVGIPYSSRFSGHCIRPVYQR